MKESKLINIVSVIFLVSHFTIILGVLVFRFINWYDTETVKICLPIVVPLFAAYTTVIVNYFVKNKTLPVSADGSVVHPMFVFITLFLVIVFIITMGGILYYQAISPLSKDDLTFFLGLGESVFGIFLGLVIKSMFGVAPENNRQNGPATNTEAG